MLKFGMQDTDHTEMCTENLVAYMGEYRHGQFRYKIYNTNMQW